MPAVHLTDAFCRNVRLPRKPDQISYFDTMETGLGLVLVVSYGGAKTFSALTYKNAKPIYTKLGRYPELGVKAARAKARLLREDPQKFESQALPDTFKEIAERWIKAHVDGKKLLSKPEIQRILKKYVYPRWANEKFIDIRRPQVTALLDHVVDHHGRNQADAVLAVVRQICNWYAANLSEHYISPIVAKMARDKRDKKERERSRILNDDEFRAVWAAADSHGQFGAIVRLALLTAQRREKIAQMKWADIDLVEGIWTVPQGHREKGTGGALALPAVAMAAIKKQPQIAGNPYVFASGERKFFNSWSQRAEELSKTVKDTLPGVPHWTMHDLRRTARSLMSRAGVQPHISERVLGHALQGVEGVYDRHSYDEQKATALQSLANLIATILAPGSGDNIVQLRGVHEHA